MTITLNICSTIAVSMGPPVNRHLRTLGPGIFSTLADAKVRGKESSSKVVNQMSTTCIITKQFDAAESFVQISRLLLYYSNRMLVLVRIGVGLRWRNVGTSPVSMKGSYGYVELRKMCWFVTFALTKGY